MKIVKPIIFLIIVTFLTVSCAKTADKTSAIDMDLLTNKWLLTTQVVDGINFTHQSNCFAFHTAKYKTDFTVDYDTFQESGGNCSAPNTPANWAYAIVDDVIEISIAGTIHFRYQVLELTSTTLRVKDALSGNNEEILMTYVKV